jgi:hypothetical protein
MELSPERAQTLRRCGVPQDRTRRVTGKRLCCGKHEDRDEEQDDDSRKQTGAEKLHQWMDGHGGLASFACA